MTGIKSDGFLQQIAGRESIEQAQFLQAFGVQASGLGIRRQRCPDHGRLLVGKSGDAELRAQFGPRLADQRVDLRLVSFFRHRSESFTRKRILHAQVEPQHAIPQREIRTDNYVIAAEILPDAVESLLAVAVGVGNRQAHSHLRHALSGNGAQFIALAEFGGHQFR